MEGQADSIKLGKSHKKCGLSSLSIRIWWGGWVAKEGEARQEVNAVDLALSLSSPLTLCSSYAMLLLLPLACMPHFAYTTRTFWRFCLSPPLLRLLVRGVVCVQWSTAIRPTHDTKHNHHACLSFEGTLPILSLLLEHQPTPSPPPHTPQAAAQRPAPYRPATRPRPAATMDEVSTTDGKGCVGGSGWVGVQRYVLLRRLSRGLVSCPWSRGLCGGARCVI